MQTTELCPWCPHCQDLDHFWTGITLSPLFLLKKISMACQGCTVVVAALREGEREGADLSCSAAVSTHFLGEALVEIKTELPSYSQVTLHSQFAHLSHYYYC